MAQHPPEIVVTNFNTNYTGVSATAAGVTARLARRYDLALCGAALPGVAAPVGRLDALRSSARPAPGRPFVIWHVRRNSEMQLALFARDALRLPVRIVFTSAAQRLHSRYPRWLISRMDAVIATSDAAARLVPRVRAVIPHGVDVERFRPAAVRPAAWSGTGFPGERGIACIGRLRPEKGTDIFVRTMISTLPGHPDATAVLFGAVQSRDRGFVDGLRREIASAGLDHRIIFAGEIAPDRLADLLPAFSLLVAPPRYEGYGMTVLEGMACGVPFVASDTGAFRGFSHGGRTGEIVPVGDSAALAVAVDGWLSSPARLAEAASEARRAAVESHSVDREAEAVAAVMETLWETRE